MLHHSLPAPEPLATYEWRRLGFLVRASLVTAAFPGKATSVLLPRLPPGPRCDLADAIGRFVGRLHHLGFRDRNLDLRNLLAHTTADGWVVAKIDSPRYRVCAPGRAGDSLACADWRRLLPQLQPFDLGARTRAAAESMTKPNVE